MNANLNRRDAETQREGEMEKIIRCCLRTFSKHLNTVETRTIKRAALRLRVSAVPTFPNE